MGWRGFLSLWVLAGVCGGCEEPQKAATYIDVASEHRSCVEDEACGVVETSCVSMGCDCGVAVNERFLLDYQQSLAQCRGQATLSTCDSICETPFARCFEGACVLTDEPPVVVRRGRDLRDLCTTTGGGYVGCPECPPSAKCPSCRPCACPTTHEWGRKGCRRVVKTKPGAIRVEVRPRRTRLGSPIKARIHNESRRPLWIKTVCGTPFYQARSRADQWEVTYQLIPNGRCKNGAIKISPGQSRPFVVRTLDKLASPTGSLVLPGTFRFELAYSDRGDDFRHYGNVYSAEFDAVSNRSLK